MGERFELAVELICKTNENADLYCSRIDDQIAEGACNKAPIVDGQS